jgi:hypothetical protein
MASEVSGVAAVMAPGSRRLARIAVGAQAFFGVVYFAGVGGLAAAGGTERPDPMSLLPDLGGVELLLYLLVFLTAVLALPLGALASFGGAVLLINRAAWREHPRLMWTLATTTALSLAYLVVSLTPFGAEIHQWLVR